MPTTHLRTRLLLIATLALMLASAGATMRQAQASAPVVPASSFPSPSQHPLSANHSVTNSGLTSKPPNAQTNSLSQTPSSTPSSCSILGFDPVVHYGVGSGPASVASADFNNDGKLDLVAANQFSNTVSILLGVGDGSFGPAVNFNAGNSPVRVVAGDFNNDGKLDLAVSNLNSQSISVLLGNGDGTFGPPVSYGAGAYPVSLAVGDFNNDGKLDLTVTNSDDTISVLLGNGNGTFQPAVNYHMGSGGTTAVAVGDFNHDGNADLVVTSIGNDDVSILLGVGDGTFRPAVNYRADDQPYAVAVGDFNADGKLDLAVANSDSADVSVLLGNGDGTFGPPVNYGVGSYPVSVAVGDFDIDGKLDLAVVNQSSSNISILLGAGNGTFGTAINYNIGSGPYQVAVGDFNADGRPDIASANNLGNDIGVMLNDTSCNTATPTPTATDTPSPTPTNGCTDAYEPDNDPAHATSIGYNIIEHHSFCSSPGNPNNDHDWVIFGGYGGTTFDMGTSNLGISADTVITLYDGGLGVIASDDNGGGGRASYIHYQMPAGGILYLEVVNKSGQGGYGSDYAYDLYLYSPGCPTPTPTGLANPDSAPNPPCTLPTWTPTWTPTPQICGSLTAGAIACLPTWTPTWTPTPQICGSLTAGDIGCLPTATPTWTSTPTSTPVLTATPTSTPTSTPTLTNTPAATNTAIATNTPAATDTLPAATSTAQPSATPTDCPNPFVDVTGNTFYAAIHYLNCRGVINGSDATHYTPGGTATRGQFAKIVVLGFGLAPYTPTGGNQDFTDVPPSYFAYTFIETGYHAAILSGFDPATCIAAGATPPCYLPNRSITRGQLTKLVVNAAHYTLFTPTSGPTFSDVPPSNVFYVSIETAANKGVVSGYSDHTFRPNNNIRRDEIAQIVYKGVTTP